MHKKGYSLVEVTVAAVIFSISIAGVFASVGSMRRPAGPMARSDNKAIAAQLAKKRLDILRQKVTNPTDPDLTVGTHDNGGALYTDADFPSTYKYWYTVTMDGTIKKVSVTVRTP